MQNQTRNLVIVALVTALIAVTCWKQSPGQGEVAKPAVLKWQYTLTTDATDNRSPEKLNALGAEGWELCSSYRFDDRNQTLIFKRLSATP
jgi:hypothetical protein